MALAPECIYLLSNMRTSVRTSNLRSDLSALSVVPRTETIRGPDGRGVKSTERVWTRGARHRRRLSWLIALASAILALTMGVVLVDRLAGRRLAAELPDVPPISILNAFADHTPIRVTVTADWQKVSVTVPIYALRSDITLWRQMNFDDWDTVTEHLREDGLSAMWNRFGFLVPNPSHWDRMTAYDWDLVPQPIRAMAYIQMVKYWSGYYRVGTRFGLPRGAVTNTINAIVMAESWFEHRGSHTNPGGERDIGLGGASEYCRRAVQRLARDGVIDFTLEAQDYFDPWQATRVVAVVAVWFEPAKGSALDIPVIREVNEGQSPWLVSAVFGRAPRAETVRPQGRSWTYPSGC